MTARERHQRCEAKRARRARRRQHETASHSLGRLMVRLDKARIGQDDAWPWLQSTMRGHHGAEVDRATRRLQRAKRLVGRS